MEYLHGPISMRQMRSRGLSRRAGKIPAGCARITQLLEIGVCCCIQMQDQGQAAHKSVGAGQGNRYLPEKIILQDTGGSDVLPHVQTLHKPLTKASG